MESSAPHVVEGATGSDERSHGSGESEAFAGSRSGGGAWNQFIIHCTTTVAVNVAVRLAAVDTHEPFYTVYT